MLIVLPLAVCIALLWTWDHSIFDEFALFPPGKKFCRRNLHLKGRTLDLITCQSVIFGNWCMCVTNYSRCILLLKEQFTKLCSACVLISSWVCYVKTASYPASLVQEISMLHLHGQQLRKTGSKTRLRSVSLGQPRVFQRFGEHSKHTVIQPYRRKSRKASDRTNGITVNVSGKRYFFTVKLLSQFPHSLLARRAKRLFFYDSIRDELFFDRNRTAFESVFNFYQSKGELMLPDENFPEQLFADELHFFGLYQYVSEDIKKNKLAVPSVLKKKCVVPSRKCQREVWKICEIPDSSPFARLVNLFSLLVIICSASVLFIDTLPTFRSRKTMTTSNFTSISTKDSFYENNTISSERLKVIKIISVVEACNIAWFTFELLVRFIVSPEKRNFFLRPLNVIDLIAIVPFYISLFISSSSLGTPLYILRVLRLSRVFRVMKFSRYISTMKVLGKTVRASISDLWTMCFLNLLGTVLFGSMAYYCESWDEETEFESIPMACWWAIVTITTVGYGDLVPRTLCKSI